MYSEEIEELLKLRNYLISVKEYIEIIKSPQVNHIKYNPFNDYFDIWTDDRYYFKTKVRKENEKE